MADWRPRAGVDFPRVIEIEYEAWVKGGDPNHVDDAGKGFEWIGNSKTKRGALIIIGKELTHGSDKSDLARLALSRAGQKAVRAKKAKVRKVRLTND